MQKVFKMHVHYIYLSYFNVSLIKYSNIVSEVKGALIVAFII